MTLNVKYSVAIDGQKDLERLAGVMFDAIADGDLGGFRLSAAKWVFHVGEYMIDKREHEEESHDMITGTMIDRAYDARHDK